MISNPVGTLPEMMERIERELVLNKPLRNFPFSIRLYNFFIGANLETIRDLISKTPQEMLEYRNFGKKSLKQVESFLTQFGLRLKDGEKQKRTLKEKRRIIR